MEKEFFNKFDSLEVICLVVSLILVIVALYRWVIIKWQSQVDLRKYVFMEGLPARIMTNNFKVSLDVPEKQMVKLGIQNGHESEHTFFNGPLESGRHQIEVPMEDKPKGEYIITLISEGQEDQKRFEWNP